MSACKSSSLFAPALLALHGSCIKSADGVGNIDGTLTQPHRLIIKITPGTIRILDIFHHVAGYGPVNHSGFSVDLSGLLL